MLMFFRGTFSPRRAGVLAGAIGLVVAFFGSADTLVFRNGDRLTGTITGCGDGTLTLASDCAGVIKVGLKQIEFVQNAPNVTVHSEDGVIEHIEVATGALGLDPVTASARRSSPRPAAEPPAAPPQAEEWKGAVDAAASLRSNEGTSTADTNLALTLERKWPGDILSLEVSGAYGEVDSEVNTRRAAGSAKWQHDLTERLYFLSDVGAEHDPARRLELRLNTGAGAGYYVMKSEEQKLSVESGLQYAHEIWNKYSLTEYEDAKEAARAAGVKSMAELRSLATDAGNAAIQGWSLDEVIAAAKLMKAALPQEVDQDPYTQDNINLRLGGNYERTLFKKTVLAEKVNAFPQIDELDDYRILSDLSLTTPLSERLSLRVNLKTEYESDTGREDDQLTNTLLMGMRYSF